MNVLRRALCTSATAAGVALLAAWAWPGTPQETTGAPAHTPWARDGKYSYTDPQGSYQAALDGAIYRAHDALTHRGGQVLADVQFTWQAIATSGVRGGMMGKRDVTVTIQVIQ